MDKKIEKIVRHAAVSEKPLERYLTERVKELGGVALKYSNPGAVGYPDRVCLLPGGMTLWVELKSRGEELRKIQRIRIMQMRQLGHQVGVCKSREEIDRLLEQYNTGKP